MDFFLIIVAMVTIYIAYKFYKENEKIKGDVDAVNKTVDTLNRRIHEYTTTISELKHLEKYKAVDNAYAEARIISDKAKSKLKTQTAKADKIVDDAMLLAEKMRETSEERAAIIAGEAWEAKKNADSYAKTEKAMKNIGSFEFQVGKS